MSKVFEGTNSIALGKTVVIDHYYRCTSEPTKRDIRSVYSWVVETPHTHFGEESIRRSVMHFIPKWLSLMRTIANTTPSAIQRF